MNTLERLKCGCANCFVALNAAGPNEIIRCHRTRKIVHPRAVADLIEAAADAVDGYEYSNSEYHRITDETVARMIKALQGLREETK